MDFDRPVGNHLNSDSRVVSPDPSPVWDTEDRMFELSGDERRFMPHLPGRLDR